MDYAYYAPEINFCFPFIQCFLAMCPDPILNIDCVAHWTQCDRNCESKLVMKTTPSGNGLGCPPKRICRPGDGECGNSIYHASYVARLIISSLNGWKCFQKKIGKNLFPPPPPPQKKK